MGGLRRAGQQDYIPLGLLARAALRRATGADDAPAPTWTKRCPSRRVWEMWTHETDCHLEYARLCLATGETGRPRAPGRVKALIAEMGYHRRDGEVAALERETGVRGQESGVR